MAELSAIDHVYTGEWYGAIPFVLRFDGQLDVARVVAAFHQTAADFVGVAAVLRSVDDHSVELDVVRDAAIVETQRAPRDTPTEDLICVEPVPVGAPLARVRITQFEGGGSAIGFALSHVVADGYGYFLFMSAWAARARGGETVVPNCNRALLSNPTARKGAAAFVEGPLPGSGYIASRSPLRGPRMRMVERRLENGRAVAARDAGGRVLSRHAMMSASLWRESLDYTGAESSTFCSLVDVRRARIDLGPLYFGNAVLIAAVTVEADELRRAPIEVVAGWIRDAVAPVTSRVSKAVDELEAIRSAHGLEVFRHFRSMPETGFAVTDLSGIPMSMLDFGCGAPSSLDAASSAPQLPGCLVLPGRNGLRLQIAMP